MNLFDVIKKPVFTEKAYMSMPEKRYVFEVDTRADKTLVKQAVEKVFGVEVKKVNIMNVKPKMKRMGRYAGYTNKRRKAIVQLTENSKDIQFFEAE